MKLHEMVVKLFKLFIVSVLFGGEFSILRRGIGGFLVGKEDVYEVVNFIDTYGAIPFFFHAPSFIFMVSILRVQILFIAIMR